MSAISEALKGLLNSMKDSAGNQWEEVKTQALDYLQDTEKRLVLVATEALTPGQLSSDFLTERVKDELKILETQLLSFEIIAGKFAQELINDTITKVVVILIDLIPKKEVED